MYLKRLIAKFNYRSYYQQQLDTMAYTARLTKQQLRQRRDATRDRSRDNTKGTVQYLVTYAYTNNNCLLCTSNITIFAAIPTMMTIDIGPIKYCLDCSGGSRIFCLGGLMGRGFFFWGGLMGVKRRRRGTGVAGPGLHKRGGKILPQFLNDLFFTRLPTKFLISAFPQKISSSISEKFLMTFFFFFSHRPFICFNLLLEKTLGGLNPSFKLS